LRRRLHLHWASVVGRTWVVVVDILLVADILEVRRIRLAEGVGSILRLEGPEEVGMIVEDIEVLRRRNLYSTLFSNDEAGLWSIYGSESVGDWDVVRMSGSSV
jgi:hypothetical protein